MTKEEAKEFYPILQAFAEGKVIECRTKPSALNKSWQDMNEWTEMEELEYWNNIEYRIKQQSEAKFRPFKNVEECWHEMLKHQPFGWVETDSGYEPIWHVNEGDDFNATFKDSTFADGTPFGIKEEE